ncbi:hypothetical protein SAMN03159341_11266 [Paenibacillus sp. 1_12]|uniref:hypothetical protein n=1 Tax=Paenibacillus sp. 1_12 TaxID=1566278 RepID=UPI0008E76BBE|nr:hypothetical protein [Paenibacillus sp. 1_12]SFL93904.1 hypothetical protein SAMN03159341_11266 [Paenibacillus sp. 1_12]
MRKITWVMAACLGMALVIYGFTAWGGQEASAEVSQETKGNFVRLETGGKKLVVTVGGNETVYPLSSTVWVYRNMEKSAVEQLQAGDGLEIILNGKEQAAYIKATSQQFAASQSSAGTTGTAGAVTGVDGSAGVVPPPAAESTVPPNVAVNPDSSSGAISTVAGATSGSLTPSVVDAMKGPANTAGTSKDNEASLDKLSIEWKSRGLSLRVKHQGGEPSGKANDVMIQGKDLSGIHLTGTSAEAFIQQLVKGLPQQQPAFEVLLKKKIAEQFQVKDDKVDWKLEVKWKQISSTASGKAKPLLSDQGKEDDRDNEKDKENEKFKDKEKAKGKDYNKGKDNNKNVERDYDNNKR